MTSALAEFAIGLVELLETEGHRAQARVMGLLASIGLRVGALILMLVGVSWLLWAGFAQLSDTIGAPGAAAIVGALAVALAGAMLWYSGRQA